MGKKASRFMAVVLLALLLLIGKRAADRTQKGRGQPESDQQALRVRMRVEEYRSLREEINNILKRGYEIYFTTLTIAIGLLGYGVTVDELLISALMVFAPILVLHLGFLLILEQIRTVRRNAAYIRKFHEGEESGIFWETDLYRLRKDRQTLAARRAHITVADILKGFPTIIDILSGICLVIVWIKGGVVLTGTPWQQQPPAFWIVILTLAVFVPVAFVVSLAISRHQKSQALQGGGSIEEEYAEFWQKLKQERESIPPKTENSRAPHA